MSHLTQMLGLSVQNFVSAASGMAVLLALVRGFTRKASTTIGSFWVDLVRSTVYILLPLSIVLALALVSQGVVQNFAAPVVAHALQGGEQSISMGPAASQIAIKQLGTNGGGFFNANSAHPLENPTAFSNLLEMLSILLISAALCFTFGKLVKDKRQGLALLATMLIVLVPCMLMVHVVRAGAAPARSSKQAIELAAGEDQPGGNMEGKELRFGIANSAIWATATTAASNGSVNAMHDSFTPLGGLWPMWLIQLGEVIFGGVGSGLYGLLLFAIVAVFVAGLMVGRTPEYLGKKIELVRDEDGLRSRSSRPAWPCCSARPWRCCSTPAAPVSPTRARTASARSSTPSARPATTTAARSAGSRPTRPSTTSRWASRC